MVDRIKQWLSHSLWEYQSDILYQTRFIAKGIIFVFMLVTVCSCSNHFWHALVPSDFITFPVLPALDIYWDYIVSDENDCFGSSLKILDIYLV
jgi:hypothetical protein